MGVIKAALGDGILTSMWVFMMPLLGPSSGMITSFLGVQTIPFMNLFINVTLGNILVMIFGIIGNALGGASFNPSATLSCIAAGLIPNSSIMSMVARLPAQAAGGVVGAKAILKVIPTQYLHRIFTGPTLHVGPLIGVIAEGVLTFGFCLALLVVMLKGPKSQLSRVWLMAAARVGLVTIGSGFTGASMNPAMAFGWAYVKNLHNNWELYYVYGLGPLVGATLSAWAYRFMFALQIKQKEA